MTNEIINRDCIWLKKEVCHIKSSQPCPDDCDLKTLEFDKDKIEERMKQEEIKVKELKKKGMFKNRKVIGDKVMGIYSMQRVLKNHFDVIVPKVVDKDIERMSNTMSTWRKKGK